LFGDKEKVLAKRELVFDEWPIQHVVNAVTGQTNQWAKVEK